jgi:hypothetical protein
LCRVDRRAKTGKRERRRLHRQMAAAAFPAETSAGTILLSHPAA